MKNKVRKKTIILLCIWTILLVFVPIITIKLEKILNSNNKSYISSKFEIEDYSVVLDVDKDNKIDVTEKVTINIPTNEYNGIYKSIPLWEEYYNKDYKKCKKRVSITNLRVIGEKYTLDKYNDKIGIRIGSTKTNAKKGLHTYTIKYRYNMGKDVNHNYDELVFNFFSNYEDTKINNMDITVNMPKEFDNNIIFLNKNKNITDEVNYEINNNSISIKLNNYLLDSPLTMNIALPDNYFVGGTYNYGILSLVICLIIISISIGSIASWKKYNINSTKRVKTVELYAPDDLDPAQIGYIYGENNMKKLTVSLIMSLANKNYISINKLDDKKYNIVNIGKSNSNLKTLSITEQLVYQELFKKSDSNILSEDHDFPKVFNKVAICLEKVMDKKINDSTTKKVINIINTLLIASIILWMVAYLFIKDLDPRFEILYKLSFISIFITGFISAFMNQKTDYGQIITAKVIGFRNYLITAEKNQLNVMVNDNPNYFYDILPYTYALNISDKWIKNFEKNNIPNIDINDINSYEDNLFMFMSE